MFSPEICLRGVHIYNEIHTTEKPFEVLLSQVVAKSNQHQWAGKGQFAFRPDQKVSLGRGLRFIVATVRSEIG